MDADTKMSWRSLWASRPFRMQFFVGLALMVLVAVGSSWAFDTRHPLEFDGENSFIVPTVAMGGDQMLVVWAFKNPPRKGCVGEVRRSLIDPDTKVVIASYDREPAAAGDGFSGDTLKKTFALPKIIPKGWTAYKADLCYACNPLQRLITAARICYSTPELLFRVQ